MPVSKKTSGRKKRELVITPASAVVAILVLVLGFYAIRYLHQPNAQPKATQSAGDGAVEYADFGDAVLVDYTGRFKNNKSVFDTSIEKVARESGVYSDMRDYKPINIILGQGSVITGFEKALIGMKAGDEKTIGVSPKDGYGEYDPTKIVYVNRTQKIPKVIPVERKYFVDAFSAEPEVGESYTTSDSLWPLKVMNVSGETIYVEQEASPGTAFEGMFGEAEVVAVTNDSLLITENPASVGQIVYSMYGPAKVLRYNNTEIVMDLNPPLAGETLEFDIKLIKLMKG